MSAIFPKWTNRLPVLVIVGAILLGILAVLMYVNRPPDMRNLISATGASWNKGDEVDVILVCFGVRMGKHLGKKIQCGLWPQSANHTHHEVRVIRQFTTPAMTKDYRCAMRHANAEYR